MTTFVHHYIDSSGRGRVHWQQAESAAIVAPCSLNVASIRSGCLGCGGRLLFLRAG